MTTKKANNFPLWAEILSMVLIVPFVYVVSVVFIMPGGISKEDNRTPQQGGNPINVKNTDRQTNPNNKTKQKRKHNKKTKKM